MDSSRPPNQPNAARITLKLKSGSRPPAKEVQPPAAAVPRPRESKAKLGAHWSDEYKERMQAEMNALVAPDKRR